jgi:hypothetical protein
MPFFVYSARENCLNLMRQTSLTGWNILEIARLFRTRLTDAPDPNSSLSAIGFVSPLGVGQVGVVSGDYHRLNGAAANDGLQKTQTDELKMIAAARFVADPQRAAGILKQAGHPVALQAGRARAVEH